MFRTAARQGFSVVELSVVVIIILILTAAIVPNYLRSQQQAIGSAALTNLDHIRSAEIMFRADPEQGQAFTADPALLQSYVPFSLNDGEWTFNITAADALGFTATATRIAGRPHAGFTITLTVDGATNTASTIFRDSGGVAHPAYPPL